MTAVVADTSPLNYRVLIDAVEILQQLYERISLDRVARSGSSCELPFHTSVRMR
ncbi:hypothetical protein SBA4_5460008 [Candidatus Sulfopaludibacter sp. SbA4]|nr:hypothetical protein SBA4_5460008 [Candidatus Sulfopaludibacter sp. SbA4]